MAESPEFLDVKPDPDGPPAGAKRRYGHQPPSAVARRNARERKRVKMVNLGFATLRDHVPRGAKNKKLSKVETLRSAIEYIKQLQELLDEPSKSPAPSVGSDVSSSSSPYGLASVCNEEFFDFGGWFP